MVKLGAQEEKEMGASGFLEALPHALLSPRATQDIHAPSKNGLMPTSCFCTPGWPSATCLSPGLDESVYSPHTEALPTVFQHCSVSCSTRPSVL